MTDKRFTEIISTQKVIDNQTAKEYNCLIDDELLELLNELHKENRQLKYKNEILSDELEQAKALINKKWSEYLKKKME